MSRKNKMADDGLGQEFIIKREFDAPRDLVFKAWTDAKHLAQWWGPRGFTNPVCDWDAQPGKAIYVVMRAPNGADYPMSGQFREVLPPERLVFTSGALDEKGTLLFEFLHTVTLTELKAKTLLTIHSRVVKTTAEAGKYIGGFEAGMSQSLERLAELVENSDMHDREIVLSREFDAPRELVWQAITDPKHMVLWWGPRGFTTTMEKMELRPGGIWKYIMHGPDGTDYPNHSIFQEIVAPERIVYAHGGGKKGAPSVDFVQTWTFEALAGDRTKVTIRQVFPTAAHRGMVVKEYGAIEGGKQTLERLAEHLPNMR